MFAEAARSSKRVLVGFRGSQPQGGAMLAAFAGKTLSRMLAESALERHYISERSVQHFMGKYQTSSMFCCLATQEGAWRHSSWYVSCWWLFTKKPPKRKLGGAVHGELPCAAAWWMPLEPRATETTPAAGTDVTDAVLPMIRSLARGACQNQGERERHLSFSSVPSAASTVNA